MPRHRPPIKKADNSKKSAFALVIALNLMAFILLLLLSISTLVRVETSTAQTALTHLKAQQNALLGLQVALGNLQKLAGPDQRATATAGILTNGYASVDADDAAQHWTGIWDSTLPQDSGFLGWLVSSSDNSQETVDAESDAADYLSSLSADLRIELLGEGTLGTNLTDQHVNVALTSITTSSNANATGGQFAFWVGDEGVKAKFQDTLPEDSASSDIRAQHNFRLNQRNAIEVFDDRDAVFTAEMSEQPKAFLRSDLLLGGDAVTTPAIADLQSAYFDLTPHHFGLLTDSKNGGWRRDLTWLCEVDTTADLTDALDLIDADPNLANSQISPDWNGGNSLTNAFIPEPTWELLRSYYRLADEDAPLLVRPQTASQHGLSPVITHFIMNFTPGLNGTYRDNGTSGVGSEADDYFEGYLRIYVSMELALWNPYDVAVELPGADVEILTPKTTSYLSFSADMQMIFGDFRNSSNSETHDGTIIDQFVGPLDPDAPVSPATGTGFNNVTDNFTGQTIDCDALVFTLPTTILQPGEIVYFTISEAQDGKGYTGSNLLETTTPTIAGGQNSVWLEHPEFISNGPGIVNDSILDGKDLKRDFTLQKLDLNSGITIQAISLKEVGTGGLIDTQDGYYGRFCARSGFNGASFDQKGNFPSLLDRVFGNLRNIPVEGTTNFLPHTLHLNGYMHTSLTGWRNSRWAMNYNPRANYSGRSQADLFNIPNYAATWQSDTAGRRVLTDVVDGGNGNILIKERPHYNGSFAQERVSLFSLPRMGFNPLGIGDLQHVNFYPVGYSNSYLVGNSLLDIRLENARQLSKTDPTNWRASIEDGSYLLNDALWDGYFFSTIPENDEPGDDSFFDDGKSFPNARIKLSREVTLPEFKALPDRFTEGARHLIVDGMFNVNSTSKEAWKTVLSSSLEVEYNPLSALLDNAPITEVSFSRLLKPVAYNDMEPWLQYRQLDDIELDRLATQIVEQVKRRGPFLTLSQFVNRTRGEAGDFAGAGDALQGSLAQAIEDANLNANGLLGLPSSDNTIGNITSQAKDWYLENGLIGSRSAGETRWLQQGDILQSIGGMLSSRSDTFVIRSYGESAPGISGSSSNAILEAIVRRSPEMIPAPNNSFGRRFEIISIRWLKPNEV
jgi:hypothetical protein